MTETTAIAEYSPTQAALADLATRMANVVYDVSTPAGMEAARKDRAEVRGLRVALEKKRVEIKTPALKRAREIDTEAARITAELLKFETPPDDAIKAKEAEIEAARQAKIAAEQKRVGDIQARIRDMSNGVVLLGAHCHPSVIEKWITDTEAVVIDDSFAEFKGNAEIEKNGLLAKLRELLVACTANQEAHEKLKREQAELARLRAEQEAANKAERDRIAAEAAERKRLADLEESNRREIVRREQAERDAANAAERQRLAAEAARIAAEGQRIEAEKAAQRAAEEAKTAVPEAKAEEFPYRFAGFPRPTFEQIVGTVGRQYGASDEQVRTWIQPVPETER